MILVLSYKKGAPDVNKIPVLSMEFDVGDCKSKHLFVWGFTAQSTQWGHVERGQFT